MTSRPTVVRVGLMASALVATLGLSACGDDAGPSGPSTVTVTPTVTATDEPTASGTATKPAGATTDVKGRAFDLGTITKVGKGGGLDVIELDRWTVSKLDDKDLAAKGYPVALIAKTPFSNQNAKLTYTIPVLRDANILYHHCVGAALPMQTRSATVADLDGLKAPEDVVLVALDDKGFATSIENYPVCG